MYALKHVGINNIFAEQSELQQQLVLQNIMKTVHQFKDHVVKEIILFSVHVSDRVNAEVFSHFNE